MQQLAFDLQLEWTSPGPGGGLTFAPSDQDLDPYRLRYHLN